MRFHGFDKKQKRVIQKIMLKMSRPPMRFHGFDKKIWKKYGNEPKQIKQKAV